MARGFAARRPIIFSSRLSRNTSMYYPARGPNLNVAAQNSQLTALVCSDPPVLYTRNFGVPKLFYVACRLDTGRL